MIENNIRYLSDGEKAQLEFEHCQICNLYPCELIDEYVLYRDNRINGAILPSQDTNHAEDNSGTVLRVVPFSESAMLQEASASEATPTVSRRRPVAPSETKIASITYNPYELENGYCSVLRKSWVTRDCGARWVSAGLEDHYKINTIYGYNYAHKIEETSDNQRDDRTKNRWEPSQPVFISAQTGKGKNTFIEEVLLKYIWELNLKKETRQRVLILSNRIALTLQMKDRLNQGVRYQEDFDESKKYTYKGINNVLGAELADVMSYQSFLHNVSSLEYEQGKDKDKAQKYLFVICDESHFFTSDSMFNPNTEKILSAIISTFQNAIRIYMTATPYECLGYIKEHENKFAIKPEMGVFYHFKRDYNYLNVKYYSDFSELKDIIENSGNNTWLIFRDNIDKGKELKEELENDIDSLTGRVYAVNSKSKTDENYQKMVVEERIDVVLKKKNNSKDEKEKRVRVLIATSVLDNGVNFRNIQNVVISDISKVKCLQMLGRARAEGDQRVTLYIKRFTEQETQRRLDRLYARKTAHHNFKTSRNGTEAWFTEKYFLNDQHDSGDPKHWIGTEKNSNSHSNMHINEISNSLMDTLVPTYEAILTEMQSEDARNLPGQKYLEYQLSWFGHKYNPKNDISLIDKNEVLQIKVK